MEILVHRNYWFLSKVINEKIFLLDWKNFWWRLTENCTESNKAENGRKPFKPFEPVRQCLSEIIIWIIDSWNECLFTVTIIRIKHDFLFLNIYFFVFTVWSSVELGGKRSLKATQNNSHKWVSIRHIWTSPLLHRSPLFELPQPDKYKEWILANSSKVELSLAIFFVWMASKLFGQNVDSLVHLIRISSEDIRISFGLEIVVKRGKAVRTNVVDLPNYQFAYKIRTQNRKQ